MKDCKNNFKKKIKNKNFKKKYGQILISLNNKQIKRKINKKKRFNLKKKTIKKKKKTKKKTKFKKKKTPKTKKHKE